MRAAWCGAGQRERLRREEQRPFVVGSPVGVPRTESLRFRVCQRGGSSGSTRRQHAAAAAAEEEEEEEEEAAARRRTHLPPVDLRAVCLVRAISEEGGLEAREGEAATGVKVSFARVFHIPRSPRRLV